MERPTVRFRNEQGEQENRPMNDAEFAEYNAQVAEFAAKALAAAELEAQKAAILAKIGLTEEELKIALS